MRPGDTVLLDTLAVHKGPAVRPAIEAAGATLLFLPPDSPDSNPIEQGFATLKAFRRAAAARTRAPLWHAVGAALLAVIPTACAHSIAQADDASRERETALGSGGSGHPPQRFFRMRPPQGCGFRAQLSADQPVDGTVPEVHMVRLGQRALNLTIAGKAPRRRQTLTEVDQDRWGEGTPFPRGFLAGQQRGQPARFTLGHPRPDGMARDGEQGRQRDARRGLAAGQQVERLSTLALAGLGLRAHPPLEVLGAFGHHRQGLVHRPHPAPSIGHAPALSQSVSAQRPVSIRRARKESRRRGRVWKMTRGRAGKAEKECRRDLETAILGGRLGIKTAGRKKITRILTENAMILRG